MSDGRSRFAAMASILEVPLLRQRYWDKIPQLDVDAVMLDLEGSAHPDDKIPMRDWLMAALSDRHFFGGRRVFVRVNNLFSPWGKDDIAALSRQAEGLVICYPKAESAAEVAEVARRVNARQSAQGVMVMVETAQAVLNLPEIAQVPGLVGLHFGYTGFAAQTGIRLHNADGSDLHRELSGVRATIATAAAANGLFASGGTLIPDYRNLDKVEQFALSWADSGYTAMLTLAPSHLDVVHRVFRPKPAEISAALRIADAYDRARASGQASTVLDGAVITEASRRQVQHILSRAPPVHPPRTGDYRSDLVPG